jgi:chemotaxis protein methyltransferase CheR
VVGDGGAYVTSAELARVAQTIEHALGMRVTDRLESIAEVVVRRAALLREPTGAYLRRLDAGDAGELDALANEVSVGETYFFRHAEQCAAYASIIAPGMRVLSAGCSSGEEPYTLAMIARERGIAATVHAFDWSSAALARATAARYSRWAMRALPPELDKYFAPPKDGVCELVPQIKNAVTLFRASLHADGAWTRASWDVVFCRNVVMYFSDACMRRAIERLTLALAPGGYLFLGHAETLLGRVPDELELCHSHNAFYYRKVGAPAAPVTTDWPAEIAAASRRVHALVDEALVADRQAQLAAIRAMIVDERFGEARDAIAALPDDVSRGADARLLDAVALAQTGKLADAEAASRALLATGSHRAAAHYLCSVCAASAAEARAALLADPTFAMASVQLAFLAKQAGDRAGHAAELARAIGLLEAEDPERLALFSGGFHKAALVELCRSELARHSK